MLISIPYTYEALVTLPGSKRPMMTVFRAIAERDVPEYSASEIPAVASYKVGRRVALVREVVTETTCRSLDGTIVEPAMLPVGEDFARIDAALYAKLMEGGPVQVAKAVWPTIQHMAAALTPRLAKATRLDRTPVSADVPFESKSDRVVETFRPVAERRLEAYLSKCAFVAGTLHLPGSEPVYVSSPKGAVRSARLSDVKGSVRASDIWRADAGDVFLDYLSGIDAPSADKAFDRDMIDVHRAAYLSWDRNAAMVREAGAKLVARLHRRLMDAPEAVVLDWLSLRRAVSESDPEAIREAATTLASSDVGSILDEDALSTICDGDSSLLLLSPIERPRP